MWLPENHLSNPTPIKPTSTFKNPFQFIFPKHDKILLNFSLLLTGAVHLVGF